MREEWVMSSLTLIAVCMMGQGLPGQPCSSYWFPNDLLTWSPSTDPDAPYNAGKVELADRFLGDTQTNPHARPGEASITSIAIMYPSTSGNPSQGAPVFDVYAFNYWQYVDILVMWGGSAGEGLILSPSADVIDAAHRNGVKVYGTVFFPPVAYGGQIQWVYDFVQREGTSLPVADKLIEVAEYYGFDGWFINQETAGGDAALAAQIRDFMLYVQAGSDIEIQWYDAMIENGSIAWQNALNASNDMFFQYNGQLVSDGFFINFFWSSNGLTISRNNAIALGRSPYELYAGADVQANGYNTTVNWDGLFPEGEVHKTSLGFYCPSWCFFSSTSPEDFYYRDNRFWVGANRDPSVTETSSPWKGMAHYIPDLSVVNEIPFVTNFNTGQGNLYSIEGEVRSSSEWSNRSLQDVLPTWRWISRSSGTPLYPDLVWDDAYYGGTSLRVSGDLPAGQATNLYLYKTWLPLSGDENLLLAFDVNLPVASQSAISVGLSFSDSPGAFVQIPAGTVQQEGWNTFTSSLSAYAGKTIDMIRLQFASSSSHTGYQADIGRLGIIDGAVGQPQPPSGLYVDAFYQIDDDNGTIRLRWTHSPDDIYAYNVYRLNADDSWTFLWSTPNNACFVPLVQREAGETQTTILVEAVSTEFGFSEPISATVTWTITGVEGGQPAFPMTLADPVPNPASASSSIQYCIPSTGPASLRLYSLDGRVAATLAEGQIEAGWHDAVLPAGDLCTGMYFVRLEAGGDRITRKLTVIR
jgi:mannosyl-glycoprotein endo-beta-N-acetylglucosaminidase